MGPYGSNNSLFSGASRFPDGGATAQGSQVVLKVSSYMYIETKHNMFPYLGPPDSQREGPPHRDHRL